MILARLQLLLANPLVNVGQEGRGQIALSEDSLEILQELLHRHSMLGIGGLVQVSVQHDDGKGENEHGITREYINFIAFLVLIRKGFHDPFNFLSFTCKWRKRK